MRPPSGLDDVVGHEGGLHVSARACARAVRAVDSSGRADDPDASGRVVHVELPRENVWTAASGAEAGTATTREPCICTGGAVVAVLRIADIVRVRWIGDGVAVSRQALTTAIRTQRR